MNSNKNLGSYPSVLITISLTLALFLIGFCGWIALTSKELIKYVKQNIEVQVYLENDLNKNSIDSLAKKLSNLNFVDQNNKNNAVRFISKDTAASIFYKETKEDYKQILGENPFKNAFSIRLKDEYLSNANLEKVKSQLEEIKGVFEVSYPKDFVSGITKNANKIYVIFSSIVLIFLLATILLINNTIKLALYSQRFIIRTMQLVGATNGFIRKPFLLKGMFQGFIASIIAIILIFALQQLAINQILGLSEVQNYQSLIILFVIIIFLGPLIGILSTFQSIIRYLSIDLDELY